jgi:hypothetical protein
MSTVTVRFENVGRGKATWEQTVSEWDEAVLEHAVRKRGVLISRDIAVELDGDKGARIYAGFHRVGTIHLVQPMKVVTE